MTKEPSGVTTHLPKNGHKRHHADGSVSSWRWKPTLESQNAKNVFIEKSTFVSSSIGLSSTFNANFEC